MASYKDTFEANHWEANTFASGTWRGQGVSAYLNVTTSPWNITKNTATRTLAKGTATADDLVNLIGTVLYDVVEGTWDGSAYSLTGANTERSIDLNTATLGEMFDIIATLIADNPGDEFIVFGTFSVANPVYDYAMDCTDTTGTEASQVLAALMKQRAALRNPTLRFTLSANRLHFTLSANRLHFTLSANRLHFTLSS